MKFSVDVECTPEEARTFLGWPDVSAAQQQLMEGLVEQMRQQMGTLGLEDGMKMMFGGAGAESWQDMQKAFWAGFMGKKNGD